MLSVLLQTEGESKVATPAREQVGARVSNALQSQTLNVLVGIIGLVVPVVGWVGQRGALLEAMLAVETAIVILLVVNQDRTRRVNLQLRRANDADMADSGYFSLIRVELERDLVAGFDEIADGHVQVYASDVPRLSVMLLDTLVASGSEPRRVFAADLTTNPSLLTQRREYLAANRRLIASGGTVKRLFICEADKLADEAFARSLLELIDHHRSLDVQCGLAVLDRLRPEQAVDYVVVAEAAVLVEEQQGDAGYARGRSSVYFKNTDRWAARFEGTWGHGSHGADHTLAAYERAAQRMMSTGDWDGDVVRSALDLR